jgi:hypothetical protein
MVRNPGHGDRPPILDAAAERVPDGVPLKVVRLATGRQFVDVSSHGDGDHVGKAPHEAQMRRAVALASLDPAGKGFLLNPAGPHATPPSQRRTIR